MTTRCAAVGLRRRIAIGDAAGRDRADRIDRELAAAGILPGHPSLYPDAE